MASCLGVVGYTMGRETQRYISFSYVFYAILLSNVLFPFFWILSIVYGFYVLFKKKQICRVDIC